MDTSALAAELSGRIIGSRDPEYDAARRVYNSLHDRRPAFIVQPAGADDIARTLAFATKAGLPLAIRSGGHSLAGYGTVDDGMVIDLSSMRGIDIDRGTRTVWADAGVTAGEFFRRNLNIVPHTSW
jgi:FAD/FMN-containing dehydrogenase